MEPEHSEADKPWKRSSYCGTSACVEVAAIGPSVFVRDAKNPDGGSFEASGQGWSKFIDAIKSGRFDG